LGARQSVEQAGEFFFSRSGFLSLFGLAQKSQKLLFPLQFVTNSSGPISSAFERQTTYICAPLIHLAPE
jgi:hypothetical protein